MADFSHVSPGDPAGRSPARSAAWLNAVSDATAFYSGQLSGGASKGPRKTNAQTGNHLKIKNMTGDDLLRGHCVQLGDLVLDEVNFRKQWYEGNLPADPLTSKIAICTIAILDEKIGAAQVSGICTAIVNVTDTGHTHATPVDGDVVMESASSGPAEIITPLESTGEQEVSVLLGGGGGGGDLLLGQATADVDSTDLTFTLDNLRAVRPGTQMPSAPLTVNNSLEIAIKNDQWVYAEKNTDDEWDTWTVRDVGCGIVIDDTGRITLSSSIAGSNLTWDSENCRLNATGELDPGVSAGCGLALDAGVMSVYPPDLAGFGLVPGSGCALDVGAGCGIFVSENAISVDVLALAGNGLGYQLGTDTCELYVKEGCGIKVTDDQVAVDLPQLTSGASGLEPNPSTPCGLRVKAGCGIEVTEEGVGVLPDDLAGDYLRVGGGCTLNVVNEQQRLLQDVKLSLTSSSLILTKSYVLVRVLERIPDGVETDVIPLTSECP